MFYTSCLQFFRSFLKCVLSLSHSSIIQFRLIFYIHINLQYRVSNNFLLISPHTRNRLKFRAFQQTLQRASFFFLSYNSTMSKSTYQAPPLNTSRIKQVVYQIKNMIFVQVKQKIRSLLTSILPYYHDTIVHLIPYLIILPSTTTYNTLPINTF